MNFVDTCASVPRAAAGADHNGAVVRPGTVVGAAMVVAALAFIALLMGVFATMHASSGSVRSCGHLLDGANRQGRQPVGCGAALRDRRIEVTVAAGVAGVAAITGAVAYATVLRSGS